MGKKLNRRGKMAENVWKGRQIACTEKKLHATISEIMISTFIMHLGTICT